MRRAQSRYQYYIANPDATSVLKGKVSARNPSQAHRRIGIRERLDRHFDLASRPACCLRTSTAQPDPICAHFGDANSTPSSSPNLPSGDASVAELGPTGGRTDGLRTGPGIKLPPGVDDRSSQQSIPLANKGRRPRPGTTVPNLNLVFHNPACCE